MRTTILLITSLGLITLIISGFEKCCKKKKTSTNANEDQSKTNKNEESDGLQEHQDKLIEKKSGCFSKLGIFLAEFFDLEFFVNFCFGVQLNILLIAFIGLKHV